MCRTELKKTEPGLAFRKYWYLFVLGLIGVLSFTLDFFAIFKVGYGNAYYAAAIKSMTQSFHNFFFVSFDPAGLVSVDKPPLGLWIQAIFVLVFGYHGWAMLLPQAIAATGSCIMMYILTAKRFGRPAGLISSLVFALTPAVVVAARNNTMDMQLIFVLLVAVWFLLKALDTSKWRYLFLCALFIGLGFNVKMLQAYMILPAVAVVYLVFSKEKFRKRLAASLLSFLIMAAVSFSWVLAVDLTPASKRPYVGSSTNNTVLELIIGHNGLERLYGQGGGMGGAGKMNGDGGRGGGAGMGGNNGQGPGMPGNEQNGAANGVPSGMPGQNATGTTAGATTGASGSALSGNAQTTAGMTNAPGSGGGPSGQGSPGGQNGGQNGGQGGGAGNDIGTAGPLRLWGSNDYGQTSWLIVLALFCIVSQVRKVDLTRRNSKQGLFVFWVIWLATMYLFFSFAGFWHRYYLCMFAPAIAGLAGPGIMTMLRQFRKKHGWKQCMLPISLIMTFAIEIAYVWSYAALRTWLAPVMIAAASVSLALMALYYIRPKRFVALLAADAMLISLLAAPLYWCATVVMYVPQNSTMPYAGPELASTASVPGMTSNQETLTTADSGTAALEKYLVAHYKKESYLVVSQRADDVAQFIVDTGLPAVAYGGFLGTDNAMTLSRLKTLVKEGKVTYFLISSDGGTSSSDLVNYVKQNATLIASSEYGVSSQSTGSSSNGVSGSSLYLFR